MAPLDVAVALLPVTVFLAGLIVLDSFKLVSIRLVAAAVVAGALAGGLAGVLHERLLEAMAIDVGTLRRVVAPVTEESLKLVLLFLLVGRHRVGFLVDAAILGFAAGTGFALVENVEYLSVLRDAPLILWIVRGFGTAVLHGTTTAIVSIAAKAIADVHPRSGVAGVIPGWVAAVLLHGAFNLTLVSPVLAAGLLTTVLPLCVLLVFERSERATRTWIGDGFDADIELLTLLESTTFGDSRPGRYLRQLTARFPGPVVADMFCLLRLQRELAIRAKGLLMARDAGLALPLDDSLGARLSELAYLRRSIGPTGLLALGPLQVGDRDGWLNHLLERSSRRKR